MCNPGLAPSMDTECQPLEGARNYAWADAITLCLSATSPPAKLWEIGALRTHLLALQTAVIMQGKLSVTVS